MVQRDPSGSRDIGLRQGVITAWDDLTGQNTVNVEGEEFTNLDCVQSGIGISYAAGDSVVVMKKQSTYFILGKVASSNGMAGSAIQEVVYGYSDTVGSTGGGWIDVPTAPVSVTAYIGSSRKCIVIWRADVSVNNSLGEVSWDVTGASSITVASRAGMSMIMDATSSGSPSTAVKATLAGFYTVRPSIGLKQGLNTFTMKYRVALHGSGTVSVFGSPQMTVIPL